MAGAILHPGCCFSAPPGTSAALAPGLRLGLPSVLPVQLVLQWGCHLRTRHRLLALKEPLEESHLLWNYFILRQWVQKNELVCTQLNNKYLIKLGLKPGLCDSKAWVPSHLYHLPDSFVMNTLQLDTKIIVCQKPRWFIL